MHGPAAGAPFSLLAPPYDTLLPLAEQEPFPANPLRFRGAALVWQMGLGAELQHFHTARLRPGGLPLLVVLPPAHELRGTRATLLAIVEETRPLGVLPHHPQLNLGELRLLLGSEPQHLAGDLLEYLRWRGIGVDGDTARLLGRMVELSGQVTTLHAVARGVYLSRRALGRRFLDRGLPAPSRWLQFFRVFRASLRLQGEGTSLAQVSRELGYTDPFTLSNQMERILGVRPSQLRSASGWEWLVECWLLREWTLGHLSISPKHLSGFPLQDRVGALQQEPRRPNAPVPRKTHQPLEVIP